jgi:hypothetical protein
MSDSLNATVICRLPVSTISANGELELDPLDDDDEPDPPRLPAVAALPEAPRPLPVEELDEELGLAAFVLDPADTESPGTRSASEAIVPLVGA